MIIIDVAPDPVQTGGLGVAIALLLMAVLASVAVAVVAVVYFLKKRSKGMQPAPVRSDNAIPSLADQRAVNPQPSSPNQS